MNWTIFVAAGFALSSLGSTALSWWVHNRGTFVPVANISAQLQMLIRAGDLDRAIAICNKTPSAATVAFKALLMAHKGGEEISLAFDLQMEKMRLYREATSASVWIAQGVHAIFLVGLFALLWGVDPGEGAKVVLGFSGVVVVSARFWQVVIYNLVIVTYREIGVELIRLRELLEGGA